MHDQTLLRIALFISLAGVVLLYFLQQHLLPPLETNLDWDSEDNGKLVRARGTIDKIWDRNNQTYATLNQSCLLTINLPKEVPIATGTQIEITGKYSTYGNKKEIEAENIRILG